MKKLSLIAILILTTVIAAGAQITSTYTTIDKKCRTLSMSSKPIDSFEVACTGVAGYKVRLVGLDSRESVNIITPSRKKFELHFWGLLYHFSSVSPKLEWRMKKGSPFALIARMNTDADDDKTKSWLVVSKIGSKQSCVVDIIDPGPGQNENARKSADRATAMPCKTVAPPQ
jgi:hypothetical protein